MIKRWLTENTIIRHGIRAMERHTVARARIQLQQASAMAPRPTRSTKQLLIDVSVISKNDAGTGIQRVVRGILEQLMSEPPTGYVIRLVSETRKRGYHYILWDKNKERTIVNEKISVQAEDMFLGLDFSTHSIARQYRQLAGWKNQGVMFHFIIHDLLPVRHPEWFSHKSVILYRRWIKKMVILANSVMCFSRVVQEDLIDWCREYYRITSDDLPTHVIPMGWDFFNTSQSKGLPDNFEHLLRTIQQYPAALMVGTIEPRKGHAQVLEAFEHLWKAGKNYNLVIVGRPGWKTDALQEKMRRHPECGHHLFWFDNASDEALLKLYDVCDGVILASLAEGFGIPLIEAIGYARPVLVRDLPVFREQKRLGIDYFTTHESIELSQELTHWFDRIKDYKMPTQNQGVNCMWKDTVAALTGHLNDKQSCLEPPTLLSSEN